MKRIILFFTVCLGLSVSQTTLATDADTVRATAKRNSAQTVSTQQASNRTSAQNAKRSDTTQISTNKNTRTATQPQQRTASSRTTTPSKQAVKPRDNAIVNATTQTAKRVATTSRTASSRVINSRQADSKTPSFSSGTARTASSAQRIKRVSRATEINNEKITNIKSLNYSKCKTVYYDCMDEICANKDTDLRRCACSSRVHEFDNIKKQLSNVEDKMLDFNQRLLTVSLDKEDAAAINVASEGETAFATKDTSASEKLLQKITETLNTSGDSKINNNLSPISLSLNIDTAWDNIDSMSGLSTSTKSGLDLYNAATPFCVEMAREVCTDEELDIAQNGYKLTIQQDCDTVAKSYKTQYNTALEKIHESGALLDMSRLNVYQQNNSDDTLTCKRKILNQLYDTSVCGDGLYKCLDMSGQYIDPSTGDAFLSENLPEFMNLLQEPANGERWSKIQQNESFVKFLDSKKKFLEPATKQCRDIADMIWQDFLDDALAQIKLAQTAKMEEIKVSCTTLVSECKKEALQDLSDFDSRAISTFSIAADKTVNAMCKDIQDSCANLMSETWVAGMKGTAADESYQKIIDTCTTIGRDCIVTQCNGTSGNFALCLKATDEKRRAILNREACWQEVLDCVNKADNLANMSINDPYTTGKYWPADLDCNSTACYIAKQIWGNCEDKATAYDVTSNGNSNKILTPDTGNSLLSWFATNTGTTNSADSCNSLGCPINYTNVNGICRKIDSSQQTSDCGTPKSSVNVITVMNGLTNYCESGVLDIYGNCCTSGKKSSGICVPNTESNTWQAARLWDMKCTSNDANDYLCPAVGNMSLYCVTKSTEKRPIAYDATGEDNTPAYICGYMNDSSYDAQAMWIIVDDKGNYYKADSNSANNVPKPVMYYQQVNGTCPKDDSTPSLIECTREHISSGWTWGSCTVPTQNTLVKYVLSNQ